MPLVVITGERSKQKPLFDISPLEKNLKVSTFHNLDECSGTSSVLIGAVGRRPGEGGVHEGHGWKIYLRVRWSGGENIILFLGNLDSGKWQQLFLS